VSRLDAIAEELEAFRVEQTFVEELTKMACGGPQVGRLTSSRAREAAARAAVLKGAHRFAAKTAGLAIGSASSRIVRVAGFADYYAEEFGEDHPDAVADGDEAQRHQQPNQVFHGRVSLPATRETREHVALLAGIPRRGSRTCKNLKGQVYSPSRAILPEGTVRRGPVTAKTSVVVKKSEVLCERRFRKQRGERCGVSPPCKLLKQTFVDGT
jgi:hypothetical protein